MNEKTRYLLVGIVVGIVLSLAAGGVYHAVVITDKEPGRQPRAVSSVPAAPTTVDAARLPASPEPRDTRQESVAATEQASEIPDDDNPVADHRATPFEPDPYLLRQKFPDNLVLPPVNEEEIAMKKAAKGERNKAYGKIASNQATEEEILAFYANQQRLAADSIQILEFLLQEYRDEMSSRDVKKHEFLLAQFRQRMGMIPRKQEEALIRLKEKQEQPAATQP